MYLLDTDSLTAFYAGNAQLAAKFRDLAPGKVSISVVTVGEVLQGWLARISRSQGKARGDICSAYDLLAEAQEYIQLLSIIRYTPRMESIYQAFSPATKRIGTNDCRIAATAIAHGLIVVTRNTRDFARIPNVKFEDWTAH